MPARLNELSYDGGAGEYVEIRVDAGADVSALSLEAYDKTGNSSSLAATYPVSSGSFTTDGTYDYYVLYVPLEDGPRAGVALAENGLAVDSVFWGSTSPIAVNGGSMGGTSQPSIGTPQQNNSTQSLVPDGNGNWVLDTPSPSRRNVACFAAGTRITTPQGARAVEDLAPGDLVETLDHGPQPVRWIGTTTVPGLGEMAPVKIAKGVLGNTRPLVVSPQHRFLLTGWKCELLFGRGEVLASAKSLLQAGMVEMMPCAQVCYYHLLFDRHEIIFAEGCATESFHPGEGILDELEADTRAEIVALFPELEQRACSYGDTARLSLKAFEGRMLSA